MGEIDLWREIADAETNLRDAWFGEHNTDPISDLTEVVKLVLESSRYHGESLSVAKTRNQFQTPTGPARNSFRPKSSGSAAVRPQDRQGDWETNDWSSVRDYKRPRLGKSGPKGGRLMKNEYRHRFQKSSFPHGDSRRYTHGRKEARLVGCAIGRFGNRPSRMDLRQGKVPEMPIQLEQTEHPLNKKDIKNEARGKTSGR